MKGVRRCIRCRCPKCRGGNTKVHQTNDMPDGIIVRRRKCLDCGHHWYTAQEPEYILRPEQIAWVHHKPTLKPEE